MFPRHLCKLFLCPIKNNRLLRFEISPLLNKRTAPLNIWRSTTTVVTHPTDTSSEIFEKSERKPGKHFDMKYLLSKPNEYSLVNTDSINLEDETLCKSLKLLKDFLSNKNENVEEVEICLKQELKAYSIEEIFKFIELLSKYNYGETLLWPLQYLNDELRSRQFSDQEMLNILCFLFEKGPYFLHNSVLSFTRKAVFKLCSKIGRLSTEQMVQLFLCMIRLPAEVLKNVKFSVQKAVLEKIEHFNANELVIVGEGFCKGNIPFNLPEFGEKFVNKLVAEAENLHEVTFFRICKVLRKKLRIPHGQYLLDFQEKMIPYLSKYTTSSVMQLALIGAEIKCIHPSLWEVAAERCKKNIEDCSAVEIYKMVYATTCFNIKDDEFLNLALKHYEIKYDPSLYKNMISLLCCFIDHGIYPENLLSLVLSKEFTSNYDPANFSISLKRNYAFLNCCIELDKPTHNFDLLESDRRTEVLQVYQIVMQTEETEKRCFRNMRTAAAILEELFGENTVQMRKCLPHFDMGLVMRFDENLKAQKFETKFIKSNDFIKALDDGNHWLFIAIFPPYGFLYNSEIPVLRRQTQIRQLKALGYKPIMIKQSSWIREMYAKCERKYLRKVIMDGLEMSQESST